MPTSFTRPIQTHFNWIKRTLFIAVATLVVAMQPLAVFAASVTSFDITHTTISIIQDSVTDSSGIIHAVGYTYSSETSQLDAIRYFKIDGTTLTETQLDTSFIAGVNTAIRTEIALDSSGNPGVAWVEIDGNSNITAVQYRKYSGASWGSIVTATSTWTEASSPRGQHGFGFDFMNDGADTDYPYIAVCEYGDKVLEWTWDGDSSFNAANEISTPSGCEGIDVLVNSSDVMHLVASGHFSNGDAYHMTNSGGGWSTVDATIFDGTLANQGDAAIGVAATLHGENPAIMVNSDGAGASDVVYFTRYNGTSWTTPVAIESAGMAFSRGEVANNIASDGTNLVVAYWKANGSNYDLRYAVSEDDGASWTVATVGAGNEAALITAHISVSYDSADSDFNILESLITNDPAQDTDLHEVTFGGGGGGGGEAVPEMSTYLLIFVGSLGAYLLYREADKIDFGGAAA